MRRIAIGDIHGCHVPLIILLEVIDHQPDDVIVTLGDYVDRGPGTRQVIDRLIALKDECEYHSLMGNHELMLLRSLGGKDDMGLWLRFGGRKTMQSYGHTRLTGTFTKDEFKEIVPYDHISFLSNCKGFHEDDKNIYVHANYQWDAPMEEQTEDMSFWTHIDDSGVPPPHQSGKTVWVGHTPQKSGNILDRGHVVGIDTTAFRDYGWLTAVDVDSRHIWQVNLEGEVREI
jgi:serine/threonine protein phosphatase 1